MKSFKQTVKEDIQPGYPPNEITFGGYTTKNLHHSADAAASFVSTIDKVKRGEIKDKEGVLHALKATDTYMKINDLHLEQGKAPDEAELQQWRNAHIEARNHLHKIGEFMHHMDYWHNHEHEIQDMETKYTPATAGAEMADSYDPQGDLIEELTDKTIKTSDRIKVARVIADMLGVDDVESMSPDMAVNQAFRKIKSKRMTPEFTSVLRKMVALASDVGIKVDSSLLPKQVSEQKTSEVDKMSSYNIASDVLKFKDYAELVKLNKGIVPVGKGFAQHGASEIGHPSVADLNSDQPHTKIGHSLHDPADDQMRRRKVAYKTEEVEIDETVEKSTQKAQLELKHARERESMSNRHQGQMVAMKTEAEDVIQTADYKTDKRGRKHRAHEIVFGDGEDKSKMHEEMDLSDDDLDKMASEIDHEDDILDIYDEDELVVIDQDTGEEVEDDEEEVNEQVLSEVLSRSERMKAKIRFLRTKSKRERRLQIALKRRSDVKTLSKRARRLAINLIKQRLIKKPVSKMSVAEKERVEKMIQSRKPLLDRLAMRLMPRVRKIENDRLSHSKSTQPAPSAGI